MVAAVEKLAQASAASDVESARSFGCVELVAGDGQKIDVEHVDVEWNFSGRLYGVDVKKDIVLRCDLADLFERLDGAQFVVGVHDGDECGLRSNGIANGFWIYQAVLVDG